MKAFITRSRFKLNPIFLDKRKEIENCTNPFVRLEWANQDKTEGELIAMSLNSSSLYATEQRITTYVERLGRTETIEEIELTI